MFQTLCLLAALLCWKSTRGTAQVAEVNPPSMHDSEGTMELVEFEEETVQVFSSNCWETEQKPSEVQYHFMSLWNSGGLRETC